MNQGEWTAIGSLESLNEWAKTFAREISARLDSGEGIEVALCGELGAGKTTFVRLLAHHMGVTEPVSSPSYVLQHEYRRGEKVRVEHWDLYRLADLPLELLEPVLPGTLRVIEWADKSRELMERADIVLMMRRPEGSSDPGRREISVKHRTVMM